jgi:hypothetical protein
MPTTKVLIRIGDFRIVNHSFSLTSCIIQHHCDNPLKTGKSLCDPKNKWYYCWDDGRKCAGCDVPVPDEVTGLRMLHRWKR